MYQFMKSCALANIWENHSIWKQSKPNLVSHLCITRAITVILGLQLELFETSLFPRIACWTTSKSDHSYPISAVCFAPYSLPSPHYHLMIPLSGRGSCIFISNNICVNTWKRCVLTTLKRKIHLYFRVIAEKGHELLKTPNLSHAG